MNNQPLIYDFIEKKIEDDEIFFKYSEAHDLNVVSVNGKTIPFVQLAKESLNRSDNLEFMTKTFTKREDEEDKGISWFLEFATKTKQERESEDERGVTYSLELMTKTEQTREDDESRDTFMSLQHLYDLYTKTRQKRESEDDTISAPKDKNILFDLL
jgi:hypothetical protein